ncbi:MAG: zf-HC2 domain-containing protein [Deltaproteobacteria bacterium]|nr:MAG: zf-HC2 domain-containing protein [Deltaproteobacteria bacterium]
MSSQHIPCEDWLASYLFGELEGAEEQTFLAHAKSCDECAAGMNKQASWNAAFAQPSEAIESVSAAEHQHLLETVFERQPSPQPKSQEKSVSTSPPPWWSWITVGLAEWFRPWQLAGVTTAAFLLLWVYGWTPDATEFVTAASSTASPTPTCAGTHWTLKTQRFRATTRLRPPTLIQSKPVIREMTVSIEFQGFAPLTVKKSVKTSHRSFDFVATVIEGGNDTKPKQRPHTTESSFTYMVEPSPSLFYALAPTKPAKKKASPAAQVSLSEDVLEKSETVLSIGQGGALVPSGKLATLAALEHRPHLLDHTQRLPYPTRMQAWKQQSMRRIH